MITCICYNQEHTFKTRKEAIAFFNDCFINSEGAEQERYANILYQLYEGKNYCVDIDYD